MKTSLSQKILILSALYLPLALLCTKSLARPIYAARSGVVNCTSCHVSPSGGGLRNLSGKYYGAKGYEVNQWQLEDYGQVDMRSLFFVPEEFEQTHSGLALMSTILSAQVPVNKEGPTRFVVSYDLGQFKPGQRDTYILWTDQEEATSIDRHSYLFGRFHVPFGLLTDEHKTYVRMQTATTFNDFRMGGMYSKTLSTDFHYDFALVNGLQESSNEGGGAFSTGPTIGSYANARWSPEGKNFYFGTSLAYNYRHSDKQDLWANSIYAAFPFGPIAEKQGSGSLMAEVVTAKGWNEAGLNPALSRYFYSGATTFADEISDDQSLGYLARLQWYASPHWMLFYKFDSLTLNIDYPADAFLRHGLGVKYWASAHSIIQARLEVAEAGHPAIPDQSLSNQNTFFLVYHFWL